LKPTVVFTSRLPLDGPGGIESAVRELIPRVARLLPHWNVASVRAFARQTALNQIPFIGDLFAAVLIWWRSRGADVVVINGAEYAWPRMLAAASRKRTICVWHGTRSGEIPALVPTMRFTVRAYLWLEIWLQRWALSASKQIAVSVTTAQELERTYRVRRAVAVVTNGAPTYEHRRSARRRPRCIAWIGTTAYKKGLDIAIDCCRAVRRRYPDLRLIAIGITLDRAEMPSWLECTGRVTHDEALQRLEECELLLGSTRYEGCSIAIMEALALGVPVVASPVIAWMIRDGGIGVPEYSSEAFAEALITLLADDARISRMSEAARRRARDFDWSETAKSYARDIEASF